MTTSTKATKTTKTTKATKAPAMVSARGIDSYKQFDAAGIEGKTGAMQGAYVIACLLACDAFTLSDKGARRSTTKPFQHGLMSVLLTTSARSYWFKKMNFLNDEGLTKEGAAMVDTRLTGLGGASTTFGGVTIETVKSLKAAITGKEKKASVKGLKNPIELFERAAMQVVKAK